MLTMLFLDFSEMFVHVRINYAKNIILVVHVSVENTTVSLYLFMYVHTIQIHFLYNLTIETLCIHKLF